MGFINHLITGGPHLVVSITEYGDLALKKIMMILNGDSHHFTDKKCDVTEVSLKPLEKKHSNW